MRTGFTFVLIAALSLAGGHAAQAEDEKRHTLSAFANYGTFSASGVDNSGRQLVTYTQVSYDGGNWGASVIGTMENTSYNTILREDDFSVTSLTDTAAATWYKKEVNGLIVRAGLDVILPTGKSSFSSEERGRMIIDDLAEDIMLVNNHGAGLTLRPHVVIAGEKNGLTWGAGMKYQLNGAYDPTSDMDNDEYDPGDVFSLFVTGMKPLSGGSFLLITGAYSKYGTDTLDGADVFRNGDRFSIEGRYIRQWTDLLKGAIGAIFSWQEKNDVLGVGNSVGSESGNSNANTIELFGNGFYEYADDMTLTGAAGIKMAAANSYGSGEALYDGGRRVIYLEPGAALKLDGDLYATFKARYSNILDKQDAFSPEDATYSVFNFEAGIIYSF